MSIKEILKAFFYKNQIEQRNQESNTEDLALFLAKGKAANGEILYGYINIKGEFVIEPQFVEARGFVNEVAVVCTANNKWGYIDKKGKYIIKPQFVYASDFYNELTVVRSANNKCGIPLDFIKLKSIPELYNIEIDSFECWSFSTSK